MSGMAFGHWDGYSIDRWILGSEEGPAHSWEMDMAILANIICLLTFTTE